MTDTWLDGVGVQADQPLPAGIRIRFRTSGDCEDDVTVHVRDGAVHVMGMNRAVGVQRVSANWLRVCAEPLYGAVSADRGVVGIRGGSGETEGLERRTA